MLPIPNCLLRIYFAVAQVLTIPKLTPFLRNQASCSLQPCVDLQIIVYSTISAITPIDKHCLLA